MNYSNCKIVFNFIIIYLISSFSFVYGQCEISGNNQTGIHTIDGYGGDFFGILDSDYQTNPSAFSNGTPIICIMHLKTKHMNFILDM